ncbi:MAG: hypothetical protein ACK55I_29785, partial [bacterium]
MDGSPRIAFCAAWLGSHRAAGTTFELAPSFVMKRRDFIKMQGQGLLGLGLAMVWPAQGASESAKNPAESAKGAGSEPLKAGATPMVLSTWDYG